MALFYKEYASQQYLNGFILQLSRLLVVVVNTIISQTSQVFSGLRFQKHIQHLFE